MKFLLRFIILAITIYILSLFLDGFSIASSGQIKIIFLISCFLTLFAIFIKPIIKILTLPINILTFGVFSIIVNGLIIWSVAWFVEGFQIETFGVAVVSSFFISFFISFIMFLFGYHQ